jgi:Ca2+-binding RTX toxin-like protein
VESLTLLAGSGALTGTGNAAANTLTGNANDNVLDGMAGADTMTGGAGNDTYYVDNTRDRVVETSGGGIDTVVSTIDFTLSNDFEMLVLGGTARRGTGNGLDNTLTGNASANTLSGGAGQDTLNGDAGNDTLNGDAGLDLLNGALGNDLLNGGAGNDTLTGGAGRDTFLFNSALNAGTNVDTITDFDPSQDLIRLENAIFTALTRTGGLNRNAFNIGSVARDRDDRIIYNPETGDLIYDANGSSSGGSVLIGQLAPGLHLDNGDFAIV